MMSGGYTIFSFAVYTFLSGIIILFQLALAAGVPWGAASMGGRFPGKYPPPMRVVALLNAGIIAFLTAIVFAKMGIGFQGLVPISDVGIWVVVGLSGLAAILNTITPSKIERIWAPVGVLQLLTSLHIAIM